MTRKLLKEGIRFVTGKTQNLKIQGRKNEAIITAKCLRASRNLFEALKNPRVKLEKIERLVKTKNSLASLYKKETGQNWPM